MKNINLIKHYWRLLLGKSNALNPAKINFRNILAVLQSLFRKSIQGFALPTHIWEQTIWRRTQVIEKSPKCWEQGTCIHCGCEILGKTLEDRGCSNTSSCYPDMMDKKTWDNYKKSNNIKLFE